MKKKTVLFFVFDGMADWECSYALVGINKSQMFELKTISMDRLPVRTMGGVTICPDLDFIPTTDLDDLDNSNTAMLILPGGNAWEEMKNNAVASLVYHCVENQIPVAAICGATVFLAQLGLLDKIAHTSNDPGYLHAAGPRYLGRGLYRETPSMVDSGIITAGGVAALEFASDIFETLDILDHDELTPWFRYFHNKVVDY